MIRRFGMMSTWATVIAIAAVAVVPLAGQGSAPKPAARATSKNYTPARTPWGDPDLQGIYTNKDENGIPIEKPSQFEGKKLEDVDDSEFAEIVRARNEASVARAPGIGGAETGAGPVHWFEHYDAKNSRPWLVVDPADGRIPPTTPEAQKRAADRVAARAGRGPADSYEDRSLYDQCITRGIPGSMMPAIYGNSYQIHQGPGFVAIRYEMIHETRMIPLDGRAHVGPSITSYMGDARGHLEGQHAGRRDDQFHGKSRTAARAGSFAWSSDSSRSRPNRRVVRDLRRPATWTRPGPSR